MKRSVRPALIALVLAAAVLSVPSAAVAAAPGTPFTASYTNPTPAGDSFWNCTGVRMVEPGMIRDKETCLITGATSGFVPGTYVGRPTVVVPPFGLVQWASDFDGRLSTLNVGRIVDNGDGSLIQYMTAFYS